MYNILNTSTLYVSQTQGDNMANGLAPIDDGFNAPFKTLERAIRAVRELRVAGNNRPITIMLTDDQYLTSPLNIDVSAVTLDSYGERRKKMALTAWNVCPQNCPKASGILQIYG